jgi:hypothetical protein
VIYYSYDDERKVLKMAKTVDRQKFTDAVAAKYGAITSITRQQVTEVCK